MATSKNRFSDDLVAKLRLYASRFSSPIGAGRPMAEDSGLSIAANVAGLLTFAFAIVVAIWLRVNQLRQFDRDIANVKDVRDWYVL